MTRKTAMRKKNDGFTLLEVMVAATILVVALGGLLTLFVVSVTHNALLRETETAHEIARQVTETVQYYSDTSFPNMVRYLNDDASDDPDGFGTSPGNTFFDKSDPILTVSPASPTGTLVEIVLHTDETEVNGNVGLPRDLNSDGDDTDTDVTSDFQLLPVTVHIRWSSIAGENMDLELNTIVTKH